MSRESCFVCGSSCAEQTEAETQSAARPSATVQRMNFPFPVKKKGIRCAAVASNKCPGAWANISGETRAAEAVSTGLRCRKVPFKHYCNGASIAECATLSCMGEVEAVQFHDLVPGFHEIVDKLLL